MRSTPARPGRPAGPVGVSFSSLWLRLAGLCTGVTVALGVILALVAWLSTDAAAAGSVLFSSAVVIAFFAISLLVGHLVGRRNPAGAIGVFAVVYLVKIVGFAALLIWIGTPAWINPPWFGGTGIATVVVWQVVELWGFSRVRLQIFNDPEEGSGG
jgi:ATP synthase protein I